MDTDYKSSLMPAGRVQSKQKRYTRSRNLQVLGSLYQFPRCGRQELLFGVGFVGFSFLLQKTRGWTGWGARRASAQ